MAAMVGTDLCGRAMDTIRGYQATAIAISATQAPDLKRDLRRNFFFPDGVLSFPLNIYEVPESHTGKTLARIFNDMLTHFGIQAKTLAWAGDNTTLNDTQNNTLDSSPNNNFKSENHGVPSSV
ncbi:hypothetical protein B0H14DRAFT_2579939 [Mycena olivaceomarginata]|nr:hypothetical protein B0H14DRAFT_2579939 [Mycena olivaceomarginata]